MTRPGCRNGNVLDVLVNHTVAQLNGRLVIITAVIDTVIERLEERIRAAQGTYVPGSEPSDDSSLFVANYSY